MSGIYLHIPFCSQKCIYCNFYSVRVKEAVIDQYINALIQEIHLRKEYIPGKLIETIYFGGGTPSLLKPEQIAQLIEAITHQFKVSPSAEITLEANPESLTPSYLTELRSCTPVNRISLGIQSFDDEDLKLLNRRHTAQQGIECVKQIQDKGIDNISIDLIYGIPTLTLKKWNSNIEKALELQIPHLSCYALTVEAGTMLDTLIQKKILPPVSEDETIDHFTLLIEKIQQAGYNQYEIANFSKPGWESRHNKSYWEGKPYLGLGASAHSFNTLSRQWNIADVHTYIQSILDQSPCFEYEKLTPENKYNEYIMTALRTSKGIEKGYLKASFDPEKVLKLEKAIPAYIKDGFLCEVNESYVLTLKGKLFADRIAGELFC